MTEPNEMTPAEKGIEMEECSLVLKGKDKASGTPFTVSLQVKGPFKANVMQSMTYKEVGDPTDSYSIKLDLLKVYTPEEMAERNKIVKATPEVGS